MLSILLFISYTALLAFWISRMKWVASTNIQKKYLLAFFLLKITAGCLYGYWYSLSTSAIQPDTWRFHEEGLKEYGLLLHEPKTYFMNIFHNNYEAGWWRFFTPSDSYWNDLRDNLMVKIVSLMDVLSLGDYYVNVVIYSFLTFFAFIFLFKTFKMIFGALNPLASLLIFLSPSCLFWTSGIHKDGLILLFLSVLLYHVFKNLKAEKLKWKSHGIILLMLAFIFPFRNYITLGLIPCLFALLISHQRERFSGLIFLSVMLPCAVLFFAGKYIDPKLNFPQKISYRQQEFHALEGTSKLPQKELEPTFPSFIQNAPTAIEHTMLRPYIWDARKPIELAASAEVILLLLIILASLIHPARVKGINSSSAYFFTCFIFLMLLLIGYTVPFAGSIVRYRAIYYMLMMVIFAQKINIKRKSHQII